MYPLVACDDRGMSPLNWLDGHNDGCLTLQPRSLAKSAGEDLELDRNTPTRLEREKSKPVPKKCLRAERRVLSFDAGHLSKHDLALYSSLN